MPRYFVLNSSPWLVMFSAERLKLKSLRSISSMTLFKHFLSSYLSLVVNESSNLMFLKLNVVALHDARKSRTVRLRMNKVNKFIFYKNHFDYILVFEMS